MIYVRKCGHSDDTTSPRYREARCWYCQPTLRERIAKIPSYQMGVWPL